MDDANGTPDGDASSEPGLGGRLPEPVDIARTGDIILDVTLENSKDTLRSAKRAQPKVRLTGQELPPLARARLRLAFRVELGVLRKQSKYFEKLLSDVRFQEAKDIADAFAALSVKNVEPGAADAKDLPWIKIHDDDEATHYAHRDGAFADLLRILHGQAAITKQITMPFVTTLAVLADRFDCTVAVSKYVQTGLKFKWPVTSRKPVRDETPTMSRNNENVLRQKILVSWLLNQPVKFQSATRELIMNGSTQWSSFGAEEGDEDVDGAGTSTTATWWYLQDGLEPELQYRRHCVLNTVASVQRHFLARYASRNARQCRLGYDSSVACDSYQLGEMFKFLTHKGLLSPVDFSPASLDGIADAALLPIDALLATLRQCPSYQIDKNHSNCGLRTKILPILDFLQGLLSANSVPLSRQAWKNNRQAAAWMPTDGGEADGAKGQDEDRVFRFTRALAGDARLRFENQMGAEKFARDVFTATSWDWSAEDQAPEQRISTAPKLSWK
ncbi:hypothetical protein F5Y15DRAFT_59136 [Xylariaceae sp. FL0016]|nr:hypothetical protein F5Y15DRAFT_59136 [Xylariaceae sp. FL0016]